AVGRGASATSPSYRPGRLSPGFSSISFPSATTGGCVSIPYSLVHPDSSRASLRVEYLDEISSSYRNATLSATSPDGLFDLLTSSGGTPHTFIWRSSSDIQALRELVVLRFSVWETEHEGEDTPSSSVSFTFPVANGAAFSRFPNTYTVGTTPAGVVAGD